jgi:hypothetical protein
LDHQGKSDYSHAPNQVVPEKSDVGKEMAEKDNYFCNNGGDECRSCPD